MPTRKSKSRSKSKSRVQRRSRSRSKSKSKKLRRSKSSKLQSGSIPSFPRVQGRKNLAKSAVFPKRAMMPGLVHVTGPSGSGKSTLISMIKNPNIIVMDTDAVTDPIYKRFNGVEMRPELLDKEITRLIQEAVTEAYQQALAQNKWLCIVGLAMGPITQCQLGYVVMIDPVRHWKQYAGRTLKSIAGHSGAIAQDIESVKEPSDVSRAITHWSTYFEIRGPFPGEFGRADNWYKNNSDVHRGYAHLSQIEIAEQLNELVPPRP